MQHCNRNVVMRLVSKVFGFEKELQKVFHENSLLQRKIKTMGYDETFGMMTRCGLLNACAMLPRDTKRIAVFIDLDDLHTANQTWGYGKVNDLVRNTFRLRRESDVIGRWFSGDEILLLMDTTDKEGAEMLLKNMLFIAKQNRLCFTYDLAVWDKDTVAIETLTEQLAKSVMAKKKKRRKVSRHTV